MVRQVPQAGVDGASGDARSRGYFVVTSGTIADELINELHHEQEGEPIHQDDGRFQIDPS